MNTFIESPEEQSDRWASRDSDAVTAGLANRSPDATGNVAESARAATANESASTGEKPPGIYWMAMILGLLSAIGPFSIDMYLPALPALQVDLHTGAAGAQATLTAYFLAFGVAQLAYGPLADHFGRKRPMIVGLSIFALASVGCALAPTLGWLTALRFVQGLGGAAVMVLPRAVIRDIHTGPTATRLMAMIMLVVSISPMLAPMAGSGLIAVADWRVIFGVLAVIAFGGMAFSAFALPETLPSSRRVPFHIRSLLRDSRKLLTHRNFLGLTLIGAFGMASFFVFIAGASFVYAQEFGLTPVQFSLAFAVNAIGFFISSQFAGSLGERFGERRVIGWAVSGFAGFAVALLGLTLAGFGSLPVIITGLFLANACLGLVIPTTMMMALDEHGKVAGLASSLNGTLQMLAGGVMITAASPFFNGKATAMVAAIALCAVIACALTGWLLLGSRSPVTSKP